MVASGTYHFVTAGDGGQQEVQPNPNLQTLHLMNPSSYLGGYGDGLANTGSQENSHTGVSSSHRQIQQHFDGFSTAPIAQASLQQQQHQQAMYVNPAHLQTMMMMNMAPASTQATNFFADNRYGSSNQAGDGHGSSNLPHHYQNLHEDHQILQSGATTRSPHLPGPNQSLSLSLPGQYPLRLVPPYYGVQAEDLVHFGEDGGAEEEGMYQPQRWIGNPNQIAEASGHDGSMMVQQPAAYGHGRHADSSSPSPAIACGGGQLRWPEAQPASSVGAIGVQLVVGSKYLRATQLLLEEIVSYGCGVKITGSLKQAQALAMAPTSLLINSSTTTTANSCSSRELGAMASADRSSPPPPSSARSAGGLACITSGAAAGTGTNRAAMAPEHADEIGISPSHISPALLPRKREIESRKAKLLAMLEEVDRRYKLYFSQIEAVVDAFEAAAGVGAAKTYTALALDTITRHFRGLRDAIGGQIAAASRALGDGHELNVVVAGLGQYAPPASVSITSSGGIGRLRYVDQQLRHHRQQQQIGMMVMQPPQPPPPAWRPQRGLPEHSVSVLRAWLFEHFLHPYPKDADKHMLARQTGLTRNQVSNWFINARVRLWKPMVEEMYLDEVKEAEAEADMDMDGTSADQSKSNTENSKSGISASNLEVDEGGTTTTTTPAVGIANSGATTTTTRAAIPSATTAINTKQTDMNQKGHPDEAGSEEKQLNVATDPNNIVVFHGHVGPNTNTGHAHANVHGHVHGHGTNANDSSLQMPQLIKKARFDGDMAMQYPLKSEEIHHGLHEPDILAYGGGARIGGGGYHCAGTDGDGFPRVVPGSLPVGIRGGGGAVSLTLGLQHPDGLVSPSLPAQQQQQHQQHYFLQQQFQAVPGHIHSSSGSSSSSSSSADQLGGLLNPHHHHHHHHHHGGGELSSTTGGGGVGNRRPLEADVEQYYSGFLDASRSYEAQLAELQARKRFASHMLHQG